MSKMEMFSPVRDEIPPLPWRVEPYGYSLSTIKSNGGPTVIEDLNIAIAEFIVKKVNAGE